MDAQTYRKLTPREKEMLEDIEREAKKRKHVSVFTREWVVQYLYDSFKDFDYDCREDAIDMVNIICDLESEFAKASKKVVKETRKTLMEKVNNYFPEDD